ncbi:MAG: hypothetical protein V1492_04925 [Candidatus Micrarchaeota archaeon]
MHIHYKRNEVGSVKPDFSQIKKAKVAAACFAVLLAVEGLIGLPKMAHAQTAQPKAAQTQKIIDNESSATELIKQAGDEKLSLKERKSLITPVIAYYEKEENGPALELIAENIKLPKDMRALAGKKAIQIYVKNEDSSTLVIMGITDELLPSTRIAAGKGAVVIFKKTKDAESLARLADESSCQMPQVRTAAKQACMQVVTKDELNGDPKGKWCKTNHEQGEVTPGTR